MHIFWINLDEREDRQVEMQNEMKYFPDFCKFERISAIKYNPGGMGCSMSHIKALTEAIQRDLPYVCIVEDDLKVINKNNFKEQINEIKGYIDSNNNWNVLLLGAVPKNKSYKRKNDNMIVAKNMQTTIGYIVNKSYYNKLLTNFNESLNGFKITNVYEKYALDQYWKILQEEDEWLCAYPFIIKQKNSFSSIENCYTNYDCYYNVPIKIDNA